MPIAVVKKWGCAVCGREWDTYKDALACEAQIRPTLLSIGAIGRVVGESEPAKNQAYAWVIVGAGPWADDDTVHTRTYPAVVVTVDPECQKWRGAWSPEWLTVGHWHTWIETPQDSDLRKYAESRKAEWPTANQLLADQRESTNRQEK